MNFTPPIYDRTARDIELLTKKAFLNVPDYLRIESNLQILASIFGVAISSYMWTDDDFPTAKKISRILENLQTVRDGYYTMPNAPETPTLPINHFTKVNDIEYITWLLWHFWKSNSEEMQYCGEIYAGEEIGVL